MWAAFSANMGFAGILLSGSYDHKMQVINTAAFPILIR
jgi:hypothetical protein